MSFVKVFVDAFKKAAAKKAIEGGSAGTLGSTTQTGGKQFEPLSEPAPEAPGSPQPGGSEFEAGSPPPAGAPIPYPNVPDPTVASAASSFGGDYKVEGEPVVLATGDQEEGGEYTLAAKIEEVKVDYKFEDIKADYKFEGKVEGIKLESSDPEEGGEYKVEDMPERFKIDIKGESSEADHKVEAMGLSRESSGLMEEEGIKVAALEGEGAAGDAGGWENKAEGMDASPSSVHDISVTKSVDKSSPSLMTRDAEEGGEAGPPGADEHFDVKIEDVRGSPIPGRDEAGAGGPGDDVESLAGKVEEEALEYPKVEMKDANISSDSSEPLEEVEPESSTLLDLRPEGDGDELLSLSGEGDDADALVVIADLDLDTDAGTDEIEV